MTAADPPASRPSILRRVFDIRPVRVLVLFVVLTAAYAGAQLFAFVFTQNIPAPNRETFSIAIEGVSVAILLLIYWLLVRGMEHRAPGEIALRKTPSVLPGALIGLGLFALTIGILSAMGIAHVGGYTPGRPLLAAIDMAVLSAVGEELIFRGAVFRIFEDMFGSLVALLVSAAFFGLIHLGNKGATPVSAVAIALEAGLLLGVGYMAVRNLWLPIGLHFGWNFAEGGIFGSLVSGNAFKGLFQTTLAGPDALTGGAFGPEASVVAVAVCTAAALVFLVAAIRNGQWVGLRLAVRDRSAPGE